MPGISLNGQRKLPSFATVAAGSTATLQIPRGPTYQAVVLRYKRNGVDATEAQMKSDLLKVRLKINGNTRWEASGKHILDVLNKFYGIAVTAGQLVIPLARPWHKTIGGEDTLAWGTRNVTTFELQVDIDAAAVTPSLTGDAFISLDERDLGAIIQVAEVSYSTAVTGAQEIANLPRGNGSLVALHMDNANLTEAAVYLNNLPILEGDLAIQRSLQTWIGERTPQTGYVHLDALIKNRISDAYPVGAMQEFVVKYNISAAGSIPIVMETFNAPLGYAR